MAPSAGTGPRRSPPPALRPLRHSGAAGPRPWARLTSHRHSIRQLPREEFPSAAQLRRSSKGVALPWDGIIAAGVILQKIPCHWETAGRAVANGCSADF